MNNTTSYFRPFKNDAFRLDEGYSEETRSQAESEMRAESRQEMDVEIADSTSAAVAPVVLPEWMGNLTEAERSELAYAILRSLRTSSIADIVERLNPLLHIDPVQHLPPEITFEIFSYLDTSTLLLASKLSKAWRLRTLDSRLWRRQFEREGWVVDTRKVREYEDRKRRQLRKKLTGKARARTADAVSDNETKSPKKRARDNYGGQFSPTNNAMGSPFKMAEQKIKTKREDSEESIMDCGVPLPSSSEEDAEMKDAPTTPLMLTPALDPPAQPTLLRNAETDPMVNWQYLYKQKRRLEANWQAGKFKNFQLPHPDHPDEAHAECVYTIQYSATHLVSGSRDKTLRIWNLSTQRLQVPPLKGHNASVLCLQFDDRPEQDLVVSGGSDCHVLLWKFSTGQLIRKLERAHQESVLNLRFDDRYLITCSKDKTIKIWNRHAILPTDEDYPTKNNSASARFPTYIVDLANISQGDLAGVKPLKEYSLLATLEGHNAAVNAIQVLGSQIVSASGDRLIKIWDVKTGRCLKTIQGHQKGIACVQFDGKRIVSGSSDETVRIFDRVTGAEVACLRGHQNLVRTVQARFGDVPGSEEDMEREARDVDQRFFEAQASGKLSNNRLTREQLRNRNAGGSAPDEIFAVGAKLPPGGGGSKWARIVSGSYDESVIIWKRDHEGKWIPARRLLQSDAVVGAGGQPRPVQGPPGPAVAGPMNQAAALSLQQWLQTHGHNLTGAQIQQMQAQMAHQLGLLNQGNAAAGNVNITNAPMAQVAANAINMGPVFGPNAQPNSGAGPPSSNAATNGSASTNAGSSNAGNSNAAQGSGSEASTPLSTSTPTPQAQPSLAQQALQGAVPSQWANAALPHHPHGAILQPPAPMQNAQPSSNNINTTTIPGPWLPLPPPQQGQAVPNQPHHHHHHHHHHHAPNLQPIQQPTGANSRVFKLQFDSRRIICCSQDPTIVGWDFADGDPEIEEASKFFGEDY